MNKIYVLALSIGTILLGFGIKANGDETLKQTELSVQVLSSGVPKKGVNLYALNYEEAFRSIKEGHFSKEVTGSAEWMSNVSKQKLFVNQFEIGNGISHSEQESLYIIKVLFVKKFELLQTLNRSNNATAVGSFNPPSNTALFHQLNSVEQQSGRDGRLMASLATGVTIITNSKLQLLKCLTIGNKKTDVTVDLNSLGISLRVEGWNENGIVPVGLNQSISYVLEIDRDVLDTQKHTTIEVYSNPNLIIDKASLDFTKSYVISTVTSLTVPFINFSNLDESKKVPSSISKKLYSRNVNKYKFSVPPTQENVKIYIDAHVDPFVQIRNINVKDPSTGAKKEIDIPVKIDRNADRTYNMTAYIKSNQSVDRLESKAAPLVTTGINFVEVNTTQESFSQSKGYLLGKTIGDKVYFYSKKAKWETTIDNKITDISSVQKIIGGYRYIYGIGEPEKVTYYSKRFNANDKRDKQTASSIIKIFGLSAGDNYFLYPIEKIGNKISESEKIKFSTFTRNKNTMNGKKVKVTSIGSAVHQSFKLNGLIPDYNAGNVEYNALPVGGGKLKEFNEKNSVLMPIGIMIGFIILIGVIVGRWR